MFIIRTTKHQSPEQDELYIVAAPMLRHIPIGLTAREEVGDVTAVREHTSSTSPVRIRVILVA